MGDSTEKDRVFQFFMQSFITTCSILLTVCSTSRFNDTVKRAEAISVDSRRRSHQNIGGVGSTSVQYFSEDSSLLVGTKKGRILYNVCNHDEQKKDIKNDGDSLPGDQRSLVDADENDTETPWTELTSEEYKTKYPIYSIAAMSPESREDEKYLFCGSGDRWISVWKLFHNHENTEERPQSEFVQKLGPHTGWVKDLLYDDGTRLLHSIGCNCIETWDCSSMYYDESNHDRTPSPLISHAIKRSIENSPTMGTTLSSDLLCLCLVGKTYGKGDDGVPRLLVSGGVDGRIHSWLSDHTTAEILDGAVDLDGREPLDTTLAHDGRVNSIVYSSAIDVIITVGNDGFLCIFRASFDDGFEFISKLKIIPEGSNKETPSRLTVASITNDHEDQCECSLALGSSNGELYFVTVEINAQGRVVCRTKGGCEVAEGNPMVYSIACEENSDTPASPRLWVAHASGVVKLDDYL